MVFLWCLPSKSLWLPGRRHSRYQPLSFQNLGNDGGNYSKMDDFHGDLWVRELAGSSTAVPVAPQAWTLAQQSPNGHIGRCQPPEPPLKKGSGFGQRRRRVIADVTDGGRDGAIRVRGLVQFERWSPSRTQNPVRFPSSQG